MQSLLIKNYLYCDNFKNVKIEEMNRYRTGRYDYMSKNVSRVEEILNVCEETKETCKDFKNPKLWEELQSLSNKKNAVLMSFVASYVPKRVSPVRRMQASIGVLEELGIEMCLDEIQSKTKAKKLLLVINSYGGDIRASFKVAKALSESFDEITVFVPHIAASGGTLIAISGNKLVMGRMSQLTLIDPQIQYGEDDRWISARNMASAFGRLNTYFKEKFELDVAYPMRALVEKMDPVLLEEWYDLINTVKYYGKEILKKHSYSEAKIERILDFLILSHYTHNFVIDYEKAKDLFGTKTVIHSSRVKEEWKVLKQWISEFLLKEENKHFIRYILPKKRKVKNKRKKKKGKRR